MGLLCIQNLGLVITEDCNINCGHCMRGEKTKQVMSKEVIDATLDQISWCGNICLCGGEVLLAFDTIKYLIEEVVRRKIMVDTISLTINGTIYNKELLDLFDYFVKYSARRGIRKNKVLLMISIDKYHLAEYKRLNLLDTVNKNIDLYRKSKHFYMFRGLDYLLYNDGNAVNLDIDKVDLVTHYPVITYVGYKREFDRNGAANIGPLVTIAVDGTITEDNTTFIKQKTLYNYGNVLDGRIDEQLIEVGASVVQPKEFNKENKELLIKFFANEK